MNLRKISATQAILVALVITSLINFLIFKMKVVGITSIHLQSSEFFFPSSKVIGSVWTLLLSCLAYSFSRVIKSSMKHALWTIFLFLLCIFYPLYTFGFSFLPAMIFGNLVTIAVASFISGSLFSLYKVESFLTLLIALWVIFVSYLMFFIN